MMTKLRYRPAFLRHGLVALCLCCAILGSAGGEQLTAREGHPQLSLVESEIYSYAKVINSGSSPWDPLNDPLTGAENPTPDYIVDQAIVGNGVDQFHTLQSCLDRVIADVARLNERGLATKRLFILIRPGTYHELLYIPALSVPLTLYGSGANAAATTVSMDLDATVTGEQYQRKFAAQFANADRQTRAMFETVKNRREITTDGTATAWIMSADVQIKNLTIENSYQMQAECLRSGCHEGKDKMVQVHHQAVALMLDGADRAQIEQVRILGHQDTLYLKSSNRLAVTRSFFNKSYIEGDVDFIFGDATAYFYQSEIKSLTDRPTSYAVAPATSYRTPYGFIFDACHFTNDGRNMTGQFYLARQWFHNQKCTPYAPLAVDGYSCSAGNADQYREPAGIISQPVLETVGKVIIMNSHIGRHIHRQHPWSDWNKRGTLAYRPVQFNSDQFWDNLVAAGIDPHNFMGYRSRKIPTEWFIAEFHNIYD